MKTHINENDSSSKPVHTCDSGRVRASVWPNDGGGTSKFKITITRSYRQGDKWTRSRTFFQNELSAVVEVVAKAQRWIGQQEQAQAQPTLAGT